ncbi:paraquat-inducible protein A [Halieaceae bacterium IMCC14734]|uniref:Paraquat-inducible protein A n=1 Tax=Candidatus Litorirhabdus singularis TaxID=2518993 RepID=A0ABT3TFF4_9GAMM|nr:paraquat-inducible protein A [Candidatus Litorirhabdus singularis]MCX2981021.1 paraquat-inducible protein A [Candidatus Litorirhabdus singularis]
MPLARKLLIISSIVIALGLLWPGITLPVLTLSGSIEKSELADLGIDMLAGEDPTSQTRQILNSLSMFMGLDQLEGQVQAYHSTRSIWGTATELAKTDNLFVAALIVLFSVIIPTTKLLLQALALLINRPQLLWLNSVLSKWSMTDVFVMALLVSYMAGSASGKMGDLLIMEAQLEPGFYYFLGYCLFSIVAGSLTTKRVFNDKNQAA